MKEGSRETGAGSLCASLSGEFLGRAARAVVERLTAGGWEVDDCDLNAEGFNPVLTEAERRGYHEEPANIGPVAVTSNVCARPMRWSWSSRSGTSATPRS
jgi:hypothetical protein